MTNIIEQLLTGIINKILELCSYAFNYIFGDWSYSDLFFWLPSNISTYLSGVILIIFSVALIRFIKNLLP